MKIEIGSGEYPKDGYTHMDYREGLPHQEIAASIFELPFKDNSIEQFCLFNILEHLSHLKIGSAIAELYRATKIGGSLLIYVPNLIELCRMAINNEYPFGDLITFFYGQQNYPENFHKTGFSPESLCGYLTQAGFRVRNLVTTSGLYVEVEK